jgi:hypothetical protein
VTEISFLENENDSEEVERSSRAFESWSLWDENDPTNPVNQAQRRKSGHQGHRLVLSHPPRRFSGMKPRNPPGCGKRRYPNRRAAEEVRRRAEAREGRELRVYFCSSCGGWHLTSQVDRRAMVTP